ncbi:MAG: NADH-quinone oxidoreductase subunit N [Myxococcales bacterium]|nr:NADH-quinone oxidoreductase subunit N [Myxococcales bacterium]
MSSAFKMADFSFAAPIIFVALWACVVLLASAFSTKSSKLGPLTAFGFVIGLVITGYFWTALEQPRMSVFSGMLVLDRFSLFLDMIFLLAGLLTSLVAHGYVEEHGFAESEFYAVIALSVVGMMLMGHAGDFIIVVIGLETMSLGVYSLVASWTDKRKSTEAGLKYFVMGAVASGFLVYGIALLYGATGSTRLLVITSRAAAHIGDPLYIIGLFMVFGALAFKVALVPFHMWTPDAYEGAPTPITGFMAAAVKTAGFGLLVRAVSTIFSGESFAYGSTGWINIAWMLSMLTMTVGNVLALRQTNIKRMLAYSSIAHAGYIMLGVIAIPVLGLDPSAVLLYLLQYAVTTIGAFGVVAWVGRRDAENTGLEQWAGLGARKPAAALAMTIFMLSLGGIPPTAGFFAKLYLFKSAMGHPSLLILVVIAAINSVISIFYYLKPIVAMYFRDAGGEPIAEPMRSSSLSVAITLAAIIVFLLGMVPGSALEMAIKSTIGG